MNVFLFQETEPLQHWGESQVPDEAAERLQDPGVPQPHLLQGPAPRDEEDVPQHGGRRQSQAGHQRGKVRPEGRGI